MSDIYTVEQIGKSQSTTPEGYLLCEGVCIARSDPLLYGAHELPNLAKMVQAKNGVIIVYRDPDQVWSPECIASFNAKPIIFTHAAGTVTPDNIAEFQIGTVINVRREGDDLFADLLLTKREGIELVKAKKEKTGRNYEVSAGYIAEYEALGPGKAQQVTILGNHLALVEVGRCGPICAIGDAAMPTMTKKPRLSGKAARQLMFDAAIDKARRAFTSRDEDGLAEALENIQSAGELDDGERSNAPSHEMGVGDPGVNLTINVNGSGASAVKDPAAAATTDDLDLSGGGEEGEGEGGDPEAGALHAAIAAAMAPILADIAAIKAAIGMDDADEEEGEGDPGDQPMGEDGDEAPSNEDEDEADMTKDKKFTMDAAATRAFHQDVMAKAAILIPGAKMLTLDAKMTVKQAFDATCNYRKAALQAAANAPHSAGIVQPMLSGRNVGAMTCDEAGIAFDAAVAVIRNLNNAETTKGFAGAHVAGFQGQPGGKAPKTMAERIRQINEAGKARLGTAH